MTLDKALELTLIREDELESVHTEQLEIIIKGLERTSKIFWYDKTYKEKLEAFNTILDYVRR